MNSYIFTALHISNRLCINPMVQNTFLADPESLVKCNKDRVSREISLSSSKTRIPRTGCVACLLHQPSDMKKEKKKHWSL